MSGPKVVSIVTREELVAAAEALLARLDSAVAQWEQDSAGNINPVAVESTTSRRDALVTMLRNDRFAELSQAAVREINFLESDGTRRREQVAQAKAQARARFSSGCELARTLIKNPTSIPEDLLRELLGAASGQLTVAEMDSALSRARQTMFKQVDPTATPEQRELASRLSVEGSELSFEEWKLKSTRPDARFQVVFTHLSDLELLGAPEAAALNLQLAHLQALEDGAVRQMRLDTLVLAVTKAKKVAVAKAKLVRSAALLASELASFPALSATLALLRAAKEVESLEKLEALIARALKELSEARAIATAIARRRTVLNGLKKLGYHVHEGLSTVTTNSGRIVMRSPGDNGYGVEVVAGTGTDKLQVRSVAFSAARDSSLDIPEEKRWCDDFGKLRTALITEGCDVVITKALGVGTVPLKVLEASDDNRRGLTALPSDARRI